jgi:hypothetical protein
MMIANVPAVMIGGKLATRLPLKAIRYCAAGLFILTGASPSSAGRLSGSVRYGVSRCRMATMTETDWHGRQQN